MQRRHSEKRFRQILSPARRDFNARWKWERGTLHFRQNLKLCLLSNPCKRLVESLTFLLVGGYPQPDCFLLCIGVASSLPFYVSVWRKLSVLCPRTRSFSFGTYPHFLLVFKNFVPLFLWDLGLQQVQENAPFRSAASTISNKLAPGLLNLLYLCYQVQDIDFSLQLKYFLH